ncbi:SDR family NAD(P)-dependent oxidoreductase [Selenomonas ruminantium]|uniref:SDR family NAD(P)-dependent oxidoreductase n=1 Tax=Selenomonas ruminantium TaxID=971 RepID=UPI00040D02FB|nr:SDR family oxidoreductase [Selenomonas ruminantium]
MRIKDYLKRVFKYIVKGVPVMHTTAKIVTISPDEQLKGRRVLITGGATGIGLAIAKKCATEGAQVLITSRNEAKLQTACKQIGEKAQYLVWDVRNVAAFENLLKKTEDMLGGKVDSLISNAGVSLHEGDFRYVTEAGWNQQMDTNLKGNYFLVKEFIAYVEKAGTNYGNIVVITSDRGMRPDDIPYGLTKVASNSFVRGIGQKVIEKGIRLNAVAPGITCSELTGYKDDENLYLDRVPGKRLFLGEEVANVVHFLLTDASAAIAGEIINCDQGFYNGRW